MWIQLKQNTGAMLELSSRELHQKRGNRRGLQHIIILPLVGCSMSSPGTWKSEPLTAVSACERLSEDPHYCLCETRRSWKAKEMHA